MMHINLIGISTIISREAQRTLRIWIQTLAAPWISAFLYIIIFGKIIGSIVTFFDGQLSYLEFVFPHAHSLQKKVIGCTHLCFI